MSDEQLRGRLRALRDGQRALRRAHNGRHRDEALAKIDASEAEGRKLHAEELRRVAVEGVPRPLCTPSDPLGGLRNAAILDWMVHGGFFDRLRETARTCDGFADITSSEMRKLVEPLEDEAAAIGIEFDRRKAERTAWREKLQQELEQVVG